MKALTLVVSLITAFCLLGCSKDSSSSAKTKRLVPATAAEVMASPQYKLEHTTRSGTKCYVRPLTPEVADSISADSPDFAFLSSGSNPCFLVPIRDGKIVELSVEDSREVTGFLFKRMMTGDPELQKALKEAGKK